jgi:uncharacterized protein (UPF0276 family)
VSARALPFRAGVGLKPDYYRAALDCDDDGLWFEVHPENYMVAGGPRHAWLDAVRARRPLSFHGVAASLAGPDPLDPAHLDRLRALIDRYQPAQVSEHIAWSAAGGVYFADLFPLPYTDEAVRYLADRIDAFQAALGRRVLIENPSAYVALRSEMSELEFIRDVCARSGCGLLLDVNNVFVSANNLAFDAAAYVDAAPASLIGEIHLAGHDADPALGPKLLIDSHAAPVAAPVWALYQRLIARIGPRPTVIERDAALPPFDVLMQERARAEKMLAGVLEAA